MNGELAQTMALAAHGSAWLRHGTSAAPPALDETNSTFRFVHALRWEVDGRAGEGAASWLDRLGSQGATRVVLVTDRDRSHGMVPTHNAVAFASGGTWELRVVAPGTATRWIPSWDLGDRSAPDQRIWEMRLDASGTVSGAPAAALTVDDALTALTRELEAARAFADASGEDEWADEFAAALAQRDAADTDVPFHPDLFPDGHPQGARRLAAVAASAWVFGGMGSWNDLGFGDPAVRARYDEVSASLYAAVLDALVTATNA